MFLMLGETVLQLVVSDGDSKHGSGGGRRLGYSNATYSYEPVYDKLRADSLVNATTATAAASFLVAMSLMFSFRQMVAKQLASYKSANAGVTSAATKHKEVSDVVKGAMKRSATRNISEGVTQDTAGSKQNGQSLKGMSGASKLRELLKHSKTIGAVINNTEMHEKRAQTLLLKARFFNVVSSLMWQIKASSVMLVGVGVKLAIHDPTVSADSPFALEQRLLLGVPVMLSFTMQLFKTVVLANRHHYTLQVLRKHPRHVAILCVRLMLLGTTVGICFVPMIPLYLLIVQACLALAQSALLHVMESKLPITSDNVSYDHDMPAALNALRLKSQRHRMSVSKPKAKTVQRRSVLGSLCPRSNAAGQNAAGQSRRSSELAAKPRRASSLTSAVGGLRMVFGTAANQTRKLSGHRAGDAIVAV